MFDIKNILFIILGTPLIGVIFLLLTPSYNKLYLKIIALSFSCLTFIFSLILWVFFNKSTSSFQFSSSFEWLSIFNLSISLGVDGLSLFLILLTTLLIPLCLLVSWDSINFSLKTYLICFLIMEFFLLAVFCILDVLLFYIFFESVLIPMYLIIGVWGSRERKVRASYFFFYLHVTRLSFYAAFNFIHLLPGR